MNETRKRSQKIAYFFRQIEQKNTVIHKKWSETVQIPFYGAGPPRQTAPQPFPTGRISCTTGINQHTNGITQHIIQHLCRLIPMPPKTEERLIKSLKTRVTNKPRKPLETTHIHNILKLLPIYTPQYVFHKPPRSSRCTRERLWKTSPKATLFHIIFTSS